MKENWIAYFAKSAAVCLTTGALLLGTVSSGSAAAAAVGLPNPMVEYDNVLAAEKAAGFTPLYLPEISGYYTSSVFIYHKNLVDIRYTSSTNPQTKLAIRSAKVATQKTADISGIYGVKWEKKTIDGIEVNIAKVPALSKAEPDGCAAHWSVNGMLFSATAEHISQPEFLHLLKTGLIDLSRHYY